MKKRIKNLVKNNKILGKLYLQFSNKIYGKIEVEGITIRKNIFDISETSFLKAQENCEIFNNRILVKGKQNEIELGKNVSFIGDKDQASVMIFGDNNHIVIEDGTRIMCTQFFIRGDNNLIHIGKNCSTAFTCFHIESDQFKARNTIELETGTTIHGRSGKQVEFFLDEGTNVIVHSDCMFSNNISIKTTDSHSVLDQYGNRINPAKDIEIGSHCWIGEGVKILKGVRIAENSIVAAGSICTKSFEQEGIIIAGIPAKVVKEEVSWCRKQI